MPTLAPRARKPARDAVAESRGNPYRLPRGERLRRELVAVFRDQHRAILRFLRTGRKAWVGHGLRSKDQHAHPIGPLPAGWPDWHDFGLGAIDQAWRFTPLIRLTWEQAAGAFAPKVGLDPDEWSVVNPHTGRMIDEAVLAFSDSMNGTTSLALDEALARTREELVEGVVERGEALPAITKRINAIFDGAEKWRARRIAWTETSRAVHAAQEQAAIASGVVTGWRFLLSSDACFGAGSLVLKWDGRAATPTPIETIAPGDMVIGGSGLPRRVLATAARPYRGDIVHGPGFTATPDHRFLTEGGWRPIGPYATQALGGGLLDLGVGESQDPPPALLQVTGLPLVLGRDGRPAVPVGPVAEHDEVEAVDEEIDDPPAVHRDLLTEGDPRLGEHPRHRDLQVGPLGRDGVVVDVCAMRGAEIGAGALGRTDPARVLGERLPASRADAGDPVLPVGVALAPHLLPVVLAGALPAAEAPAGLDRRLPLGLELTAAGGAGLREEPRDARIGLLRPPLALAATEPGAPRDLRSEGPEGEAALIAADDRRLRPQQVPAFVAAEPAAGQVARERPIGLAAPLASPVGGPLPGGVLARPGAEPAPPFEGARLGLVIGSAVLAPDGVHDPSSVPRLRTLVNGHGGLVYDIEVEDDRSFVLACGLIAHNCPICVAIAARAPAVRLGHAFAVIGDNPHYSQIRMPPVHPHCGCSALEVLDTDPQPAWSDTLHQPEPATEEEHEAVGRETQARDEETLKPAPRPKPKPAPVPVAAAKPKKPRVPKPPAPPKPKPPELGPTGKPVPDALVDQTGGKTRAAVQDVLAEIGKIHGDGSLPKIPIEHGAGGGRLGSFTYNGMTMRPIKIGINTKADHPRMTMAHEIGHFLENAGIPKPTGGPRIFQLTPELRDWLREVKDTKAIRALEKLEATDKYPFKRPDGSEVLYPVDKKYVRYLLRDEEIWARSYAQYIATKSGNKAMMEELDGMRNGGTAYANAQWSDDDFKPVARAIDAMFLKLGWIG